MTGRRAPEQMVSCILRFSPDVDSLVETEIQCASDSFGTSSCLQREQPYHNILSVLCNGNLQKAGTSRWASQAISARRLDDVNLCEHTQEAIAEV